MAGEELPIMTMSSSLEIDTSTPLTLLGSIDRPMPAETKLYISLASESQLLLTTTPQRLHTSFHSGMYSFLVSWVPSLKTGPFSLETRIIILTYLES